MVYLEDEEIRLRCVEPEDIETLYKWENDTLLWEDNNNLNPYSKFTIKEYISRAAENDVTTLGQMRFMITLKEENLCVGTADIFDIDFFHGRGAIGLLVAGEFRGRGFAKRALNLITEYAANILLLHQLYVHIAANNRVCLAMFEQSDFIKCGVMKEWIKYSGGYRDVVLYQKIIRR